MKDIRPVYDKDGNIQLWDAFTANGQWMGSAPFKEAAEKLLCPLPDKPVIKPKKKEDEEGVVYLNCPVCGNGVVAPKRKGTFAHFGSSHDHMFEFDPNRDMFFNSYQEWAALRRP